MSLESDIIVPEKAAESIKVSGKRMIGIASSRRVCSCSITAEVVTVHTFAGPVMDYPPYVHNNATLPENGWFVTI